MNHLDRVMRWLPGGADMQRLNEHQHSAFVIGANHEEWPPHLDIAAFGLSEGRDTGLPF